MKLFISTIALFAFAFPAFAEEIGTEVGSVVYRATGEKNVDFSKNNTTEFGFQLSSINTGTRFANIAVTHDFQSGLTIGGRGLMPVDYASESQTYIGQVFTRFPLMNNENILYIETALSAGVFSNAETPEISSDNTTFMMLGASYGYTRRFGREFSAGIALGVDWTGSRMIHDQVVSRSTIVNHATINGGYYF